MKVILQKLVKILEILAISIGGLILVFAVFLEISGQTLPSAIENIFGEKAENIPGFKQNIESMKKEIIELVNQERIKVDLQPLKDNSLLDKSAELKAKDMLGRVYWSHNAPDGVEPWMFFQKVGYLYAKAGENQAKNFYNASDVVNSWMISKTHRENILDGEFNETGIGVIYSTENNSLFDKDSLIVVQHFGTQMKQYTESSTRTNRANNQIPSRTGRIIQYHDWCNNKDISVYENEIIVKKSYDSNIYGMTQEDWNCYENTFKNKR